MVARSNAIMVLVELALFALGWSLALGPWAPVWQLVALSVGSIAALYLLITLLSFAIAYRYRSPAPADGRVGAVGGLWLLVKETLAMLVVFTVLVPLEPFLRPRLRHRDGDGDVAVLLLHGFLCNGGVWASLRRALRRRGVGHVHTLNMEPPLGSITGFARQASDRIDAVCAATGCTKVIVAGHSMGGLVARRMLDLGLQRDRVVGLVTIGTPHHGTAHAWLLGGAGAMQMRGGSALAREVPGNPWLERLNAAENEPSPLPVLAIWSYQDNIVAPQRSATLANAETLPLRGVGHMEMLFSRQVLAPVTERIVFWRDAARGR